MKGKREDDKCPKTLITNPGFSKIWDQFHIYDFVFITFLIFRLYWVFTGKVLEMEPCGSPGEEWCKNKPDVATSQRRDVAGKTQQTLSHEEAIKGMGESNFRGSKIICSARV